MKKIKLYTKYLIYKYNKFKKKELIFEVNYLDDKANQIQNSIISFMQSVYCLTVNDSLRFKIYDNLKDSLRKLIMETKCELEIEVGLKILLQLGFNSQVTKEICADTELIEFVRSLTKQETFVYQQLMNTCNDFIWIIENYLNDNFFNNMEQKEDHVMISYHPASKEVSI